MSGKNKVNPDHYKVGGRLSQDDLARERRRQTEPLFGATRGRKDKPLPPWMLNEQGGRPAEVAQSPEADSERQVPTPPATPRAAKPAARPQPLVKAAAKTTASSRAKARTSKPKPKTQAVKRGERSARKAPVGRKSAKSRRAPASAASKRPHATARKSPRSAAKRSARSTKKGATKKTR